MIIWSLIFAFLAGALLSTVTLDWADNRIDGSTILRGAVSTICMCGAIAYYLLGTT